MNLKKISVFIFLIGISTISISYSNGILDSKTPLDLYLDSDLILYGQVLSLTEIKDESNTTPRTEYEIKILQHVKGNTEKNQFTVVGFGVLNSTIHKDNQMIMSKGQIALLMLNEQIDGNWYISPFSSSSESLNPDSHFILPPLKLFKAGIAIEDIQCKSFLEFALKSSTGSPVCLKQGSKDILYNRGWVN